ncbi:MAG: ABC transporter ATP-binding protein [Candidatus Marinimicrobia bacterium]|nr:ABC transporter ATP-binding protein [Candidatus Neomarinimicrobiota bacterium]
MSNKILSFKNISKSYSNIVALEQISFDIPKNSIFGILGANGSGKSTFMKILPGLIQNWSGEIFHNGKFVEKNNIKLRDKFGYLIEAPTFYEYLSARKNLEILSRISPNHSLDIDYILELVNLKSRSEDKVSAYSYGMKQRLGIAQCLIHNPEILILDEPNNGLDPNGIQDMIKLIKNLRTEGKTICLSTHNLRDVEELCTHFTVFQNGKNSKTCSMEKQIKNSKTWIVNTKDIDSALEKLKNSDIFEVISVFNKNILIESMEIQSLDDIHEILSDIEIYKISKESNLIGYFDASKTDS